MRDLRSDKLITDLNGDGHDLLNLGAIGINVSSPAADFEIYRNGAGDNIAIKQDDSNANIAFYSARNSAHPGGRFDMKKSRGTIASPTVIVSGDQLGAYYFYGHDGASYVYSAAILVSSEGTIGSAQIPSNFEFYTHPDSTSSFREVLRIDSAGHVTPREAAGTQNLGNATYYWNDVSYKTATDRGCLGAFDAGVELRDGSIVSDIEALEAIQVHPTKKTVYGVPRLDYRTMPKAVFKPAADDKGKPYERDEDDEPKPFVEKIKTIVNGEERTITIQRQPEDGAEMTALFSIMLGAIKELSARVKKLEAVRI